MSGSGNDTLPDVRMVIPDVRKVIPDVREWSECPSGCQGVVGMLYRMFGSGPDTLLDDRKVLPNA